MTMLSPAQTAACTPYAALVEALRVAVLQVADGCIWVPHGQTLRLGHDASVISMLASAPDLTVHHLAFRAPENPGRHLPIVQGRVQVLDSATGTEIVTLDGPMLTARRTAALSMLGIATLLRAQPASVTVIGTGNLARHHVDALQALYAGTAIEVLGRTPDAAEDFCAELGAQAPVRPIERIAQSTASVVISCTSSVDPVYDLSGFASRLLIAVGSLHKRAAEMSSRAVRSSRVYADDVERAKVAAGDLLRAGVCGSQIKPLSDALQLGSPVMVPNLLKIVGSAAWDLAAARVAVEQGAVPQRQTDERPISVD